MRENRRMTALPEHTPAAPAARPAGPRPGLRERKKARTRAAIREHAFRLFRAQGYDATTVEQIAEAAEVSPSTFFRYFPTKEDVVGQDDPGPRGGGGGTDGPRPRRLRGPHAGGRDRRDSHGRMVRGRRRLDGLHGPGQARHLRRQVRTRPSAPRSRPPSIAARARKQPLAPSAPGGCRGGARVCREVWRVPSRSRRVAVDQAFLHDPQPPRCDIAYSAPNDLISSYSASVSSLGSSPLLTFSLCTWWRMPSTTSGLASVVTSPISAKLDTAAITRRMIFPDRVLGMSGTIHTCFGRAILPISVSIALVTLPAISSLATKPGLSETYISTARPRMSSMTGTAAASATSGTVSDADSSSLVPSRCPATLITSSTRPRIR